MLTIHVWPRRLKEFLLTHPLYKSPSGKEQGRGKCAAFPFCDLTSRSHREKSHEKERGSFAALFSSRPLFPSSAFPNSSAQRRDTLLAAAPPDGSPSLSLRVGSCTARTTDKRRLPRGSRPAPGSRRLSHIRQITLLSLPCLGVYYWLRTQDSLTPATFRLPVAIRSVASRPSCKVSVAR